MYCCIVLCNRCTFGTDTHEEKFLPALQQGHEARPCLCSQGGLGDQEDLGDREDQQVQLGLGHPDWKKQQQTNRKMSERNTRKIGIFSHGKSLLTVIRLGLPIFCQQIAYVWLNV